MKAIRPIVLTDAMLVSSTIAEPDSTVGETSAWSPTEINAAGDLRYQTTLTATVTLSIAAPGVVTWTAHGLAVNSPVVLTTTGALPSPFVAGTTYYVASIIDANTFTLATKPNGRAITTTGTQSGVHTGSAPVHTVFEALQGQRATVTISNATPAVVTWAAHGRVAGDGVVFTTTGGLPAPLVAGTTYYVLAAGLTTGAFEIATTPTGAAINTTTAGSGAHTGGLALNYNAAPLQNPTVWAAAQPTNRWAMLDDSMGTLSVAQDHITVAIKPGRFDSIALIGVDATTVEVSLNVPGTGVVYDYTTNLSTGVNVGNWYEYFYEDVYNKSIVALDSFVTAAISALPAFADATLTVTITRTGGQVQCGLLKVGLSFDLGTTLEKPEMSVLDYSVKNTDDFGNITITQRPYSDFMKLKVAVDDTKVDAVVQVLKTYRATPMVWLGAEDAFSSTIVFGFIKDWSMVPETIDQPAILSIQIEGLT